MFNNEQDQLKWGKKEDVEFNLKEVKAYLSEGYTGTNDPSWKKLDGATLAINLNFHVIDFTPEGPNSRQSYKERIYRFLFVFPLQKHKREA